MEAEGCSLSATLHCGNVQCGSSAAHCRQGSALSHQDFCERVPAVPSLPPSQLHRDNRPRSHPPHFASTASVPTPPPPQSIKMRRFAPRLLSVFSLLHSSPSVGVSQSKSGCVCLISQGEAVACMSCRGANCSDFLG